MTAVFSVHPEGFSPKDPMAFSNNQQSLLGVGFFPARRRRGFVQNDRRGLLCMGFSLPADRRAPMIIKNCH
jgi:hypothetical protein